MKVKVVMVILFFSTLVFSAVKPSFIDGIRPLGMGGAFTAVADDYNLLQYNPANLAKAKGFQLNIPHIEVETSQKSMDFISYFLDHKDLFNGDLTNWTMETVNKLTNASLKLNANANISVLGINTPIGNFGTGLFSSVYTNATTVFDIFNINARFESNIDFVLPVSFGTMLEIPGLNSILDSTLGGGRLGVGATAKIIQRRQLIEDHSVFELSGLNPADMLSKLSTPTTGIGFDLGVNYFVPSIGSTFSLVVRDFYTDIGGKVNSNYIFGYAIDPNFEFLKSIADVVVALDVVDLFGDVTIMNKIHIGLEAKFLGFLYARVGFYQGWSGFGLGIGRYLEYANYGTELGMYPGQIEERQHRVSLALSF
ncbi:MAG: hypothetical protein ABH873_00130 [Candidatus Firestonebacteria bacterium]